MRKLWIIAAAVALATGCSEEQNGAFVVTGNIENAPGKKIMLMEVPFTSPQPVILDSTTLKEDGSFTLRGRANEEGIFRVLIDNGPDVIVINDNKTIRLSLDVNNYRNYKVDGSPATESLHQLFENYRAKDSALLATFKQIDTTARKPGTDSLVNVLKAQRDQRVKELNDVVINFIKTSRSPAAKFYALGLASRTLNPDELRPLAEEAAVRHPEHEGLTNIVAMLNQQKPGNQQYPLLNQQAPNLTMQDLNGKPVSISDFKGKYVLVDFWASWCGPCREENPNVVAAYNKYKDKNFTILGVSLDQDKAAWQQAIVKDKLTWNHMSDLKQWESAAVSTYKFEGIPFNVLLDPSGKIIASGLRGEELDRKLAEVTQ